MSEDKDDVRHLFMCQMAIATSDGHGSTLNVVVSKRCCLFFVYVFGLVYEIRDNKKLIVNRELN